MDTNHTSQKPHAILVAYPLQGHVIPTVHLAIKLASLGFTITFVNTRAIHHQTTKAQPSIDPDIFSRSHESGLDIRYTTVSDGLPLGFDRSLNHDQFMAALLHVFSAHVEDLVGQLVGSGEAVHCLIADTFFVWPSKIARKFGLLYVSFWTEAALVFTLYYHIDLLKLNGHFGSQDCRDDPIDYIPGVKAIKTTDMTSYLQETCTSSVCHEIIFNCFEDVKKADFVLCNTVEELEPEIISALQAKMAYYAIGPTFPKYFAKSSVATSLWSESDCTQWLETKARASVLYVSFGSYAHLPKRDLLDFADGLSLSKVNFVWVLRPDIVSSNEADPLPAGFKEEVADRALIVPWCRQKAMLAHPAVGGFLTHCGWNSILESIWCEVPLLCFPLLTDQFTNRKLVVDDWKIGINVSHKKVITKEDISQNIDGVMRGKLGDEFRKNIKELKKTLENAMTPVGSSESNMTRFINDLKAKLEKRVRSQQICT
ncbi:hypothetical protein K2173_023755 [Erythroxylum novogranatense]|uniref:Glycosyltransferase n=1 Tax=Erythroxylum novogranatense TaxID=1862640 RepID=A0AAV8TPI8_9ROSI|nr:hypothetical protein K2173_023755 [Erythroxylum novogranatense]